MVNQLKINGINVSARGNCKNRCMVFLHGNSLSSLSFNNQLNFIDDIPMLAIDLPGHGLSEKAKNPEDSYCLPGYINTLKEVVNKLGLTDIILVGHSLGGHIALEATSELDEVKGVMIFGTPPIGIPPALDKAFLPHEAMPLLFKHELGDLEIASLLSALLHSTGKSMYQSIIEQIKGTDGMARAMLAQSIAAGKFKNEIDIIQTFSIPIAILHGEDDALINKNYLENLLIPKLWENKIHMIQNAGHSMHSEQPAQFNLLLHRFYNFIFNK